MATPRNPAPTEAPAATPAAMPAAMPDLHDPAVQQALHEAQADAARGAGLAVPEVAGVTILSQRHSGSPRAPHPLECQLEIALRRPGDVACVAVRFHGRGYRDAASAEAVVARSRAAGLAAPPLGAALLHLPRWNLVLWAWPNDPALPQLAALTTPAGAQAALPDELRHAVRVVAVEPVSHAALRHAVLRVTWVAADGAAGRLRRLGLGRAGVFFAKTYAGLKGHEVQARNEHFWQLASLAPTAPPVPRPLGLAAEWRTVWQAAAPGRPLVELLDGPQAEPALAAAARSLARLHGVPVECSARRDLAHWLAEIERRQHKLGRLLPTRRLPVDALAAGLRQTAAALPPMRLGTAHGDFQFGQCVLQGDRAVLLDLDSLVTACPMEDLAEFSVKLHTLPLGAERVAALAQALHAAYAREAPWHFDPAWLLWHTAVQHLLQGTRAAMARPAAALSPEDPTLREPIDAALRHLRALREFDVAASA